MSNREGKTLMEDNFLILREVKITIETEGRLIGNNYNFSYYELQNNLKNESKK